MVLWGTMGPTHHLGLRDVAYALRYPWIQHVRTRWLQLGHFQISKYLLRLPSIHPIPVPFDQKFNVAMFVSPPLLNGFYAPFFLFRFWLHTLLLQTHSGFGQYSLSRPHINIYHHSQTFANIQIISMEKSMGTMYFYSSVHVRLTACQFSSSPGSCRT